MVRLLIRDEAIARRLGTHSGKFASPFESMTSRDSGAALSLFSELRREVAMATRNEVIRSRRSLPIFQPAQAITEEFAGFRRLSAQPVMDRLGATGAGMADSLRRAKLLSEATSCSLRIADAQGVPSGDKRVPLSAEANRFPLRRRSTARRARGRTGGSGARRSSELQLADAALAAALSKGL